MTLWVDSAGTEQRTGQEMTTPKTDDRQRTCMGTESGFPLPVKKREIRTHVVSMY